MASHTDAYRAECRRAYEAGETNGSIRALSRKAGVDVKTLHVWSKKDGWIPPIPSLKSHEGIETKEEIKSRVIDIATGRAVESGIIAEMVQSIALNFYEDVAISGMLMRAGRQTLQDFLDGKIEPGPMQNKADVLKSVVSANKSVFELRRQMAGKRAGDASVDLGPRADPKINVSIQRLPSTKTEYEARQIA